MTERNVPYAGVATRAVALAIDIALAHVIVFAGGAILALVGSLVADLRLDTLAKLLAAIAWITVIASYFVLFWGTAGQTPGMRLIGLRLITRRGEHPGVTRSLIRLIGLGLAIIPLFLGFLPVLIDTQRRGLHDYLAGTVVLYAGLELPAAPATARARPAPREPAHARLIR